MPRPISPGERHTYDEWRALGYQVQRGEHSYARGPQGQALFGPEQVRPRNTAPPQGWQTLQRAAARRARRAAERPQAVPDPAHDTVQFVWDGEAYRAQFGQAVRGGWLDDQWITFGSGTYTTSGTWGTGNFITQPRQQHVESFSPAALQPAEPPPVVQRAVAQYAPQDEPSGFQLFNRKIANKET